MVRLESLLEEKSRVGYQIIRFNADGTEKETPLLEIRVGVNNEIKLLFEELIFNPLNIEDVWYKLDYGFEREVDGQRFKVCTRCFTERTIVGQRVCKLCKKITSPENYDSLVDLFKDLKRTTYSVEGTWLTLNIKLDEVVKSFLKQNLPAYVSVDVPKIEARIREQKEINREKDFKELLSMDHPGITPPSLKAGQPDWHSWVYGGVRKDMGVTAFKRTNPPYKYNKFGLPLKEVG
jgi:hypothetical protein